MQVAVPEFITYPGNLVKAVVEYLGTRPYAEVHQLVNGLSSLGTPATAPQKPMPWPTPEDATEVPAAA